VAGRGGIAVSPGAASSPEAEPMTRASLEGGERRLLSRGGWANPDVVLVVSPRGPIVVKDFGPRGRFVRTLLGPWLLGRELRAYRRLAGMPAVPRLLCRIDAAAIALEYRPGVFLSRRLAGRLARGFVDELAAVIEEMHRRGVVHLDLRHRSNVLAGEDDRPVVIDFASALVFDPACVLGRLGILLFAPLDRWALEKWRVRLTPTD
jgi:predicted Ser/Thr protein kinase